MPRGDKSRYSDKQKRKAEYIAEGYEKRGVDDSLTIRIAVVHASTCRPHPNGECWWSILTLRRPDQFCSVDQGIFGHLTRRNPAVLAAERGDHAEARCL